MGKVGKGGKGRNEGYGSGWSWQTCQLYTKMELRDCECVKAETNATSLSEHRPNVDFQFK